MAGLVAVSFLSGTVRGDSGRRTVGSGAAVTGSARGDRRPAALSLSVPNDGTHIIYHVG
jgi:hypothetical protein